MRRDCGAGKDDLRILQYYLKLCERQRWRFRNVTATSRRHGADRDRTGDPLLAKQVLSQLSYRPEVFCRAQDTRAPRPAKPDAPAPGFDAPLAPPPGRRPSY